jgi:hypothetical protein
MLELAQALVMVSDKPDVIIADSDWALHPARASRSIGSLAEQVGEAPFRPAPSIRRS